ncbi:MAG: VWA domain-containing protein, partial [Thermoanaerobaculia bacterium]
AGDSPGDWQVVVYFDAPLSTPEGLKIAARTLARQAESLITLGPVEVVLADPLPRLFLAASRSSTEVEEALKDVPLDSFAAGELAWLRQRFLAAVDSADSETVANHALGQEVALLEQQRSGLLRWLADRPSRGPRVVFLVQNGFDLNPREFYLERVGRTFYEDPRSEIAHTDLARTLAAEGWIAVVLAMGNTPEELTEPLAPLDELREATAGVIVHRPKKLAPTLEDLAQRHLLTVALSGEADGEPRSLEVRHRQTGRRLSTSAWTAVSTPRALAELTAAPDADATGVAASTSSVVKPVIRLLRPEATALAGLTRFRTVTGRRQIERVAFYLDGKEVVIDERGPFSAVIDLGPSPRPCTLEAVAFSPSGRRLGVDAIDLNTTVDPLEVAITDIVARPEAGILEIEADVKTPAGAELDRVEFFFDENLELTLNSSPYRAQLPLPETDDNDYVKVVAHLTDGSWAETAKLVASSAATADVLDVNLVELLAVVTPRNRDSLPLLEQSDFSIRRKDKLLPVQRFARWDDLPLALGLVIDTSDSMEPLLAKAHAAAERFFEQVLRPGDRAFVVDFDTMPRMTGRATDDKDELLHSLEGLDAKGNTALYDAIVYSLLQFDSSPGRKAVVVLTDGKDYVSRYQPSDCIRQARLQGVPVYLIALGAPPDLRQEPSQMRNVKIATETGGKVFYLTDLDDLDRVYERIDEELRSQFFLAFSTDHALTQKELRDVKVEVRQKGLAVRTLLARSHTP